MLKAALEMSIGYFRASEMVSCV